jgi:nucleotide-binding universal stress UspA family protein
MLTVESKLHERIEVRTMNIKEVVFPVDFSDRSASVCPYVAAVTQRFKSRLTLLHVVECLPSASSPSDRLNTPDQVELESRKDEAARAMTAFQHQYIPHVESEVCVLVGDPATAIVTYGGESQERILVMPTRGYGPFRRMLLGSVTAKVLHDAKCPVLTSPHMEQAIRSDEWFGLRRILCAVGLDWETDMVLKRSAELASQLEAELMAVHVITPVEEGLLPLMDPGSPPLSTDSVEAAMQDALNRTGIPAQVLVSVGEISRQVASAARDHKADLIVIGRGGAPELPGRLGSHGYAIVRRAPCPVMCV